MESQGEGVKEMVALLVHCCRVGGDSAKGIGAVLGSEAAGDFLFYRRHANSLLGEVIGEGDAVIGSEAPDPLGIGPQAEQEIGWLCRVRPRFPDFSTSGLTAPPSLRILAYLKRKSATRSSGREPPAWFTSGHAATRRSIMRSAQACSSSSET